MRLTAYDHQLSCSTSEPLHPRRSPFFHDPGPRLYRRLEVRHHQPPLSIFCLLVPRSPVQLFQLYPKCIISRSSESVGLSNTALLALELFVVDDNVNVKDAWECVRRTTRGCRDVIGG